MRSFMFKEQVIKIITPSAYRLAGLNLNAPGNTREYFRLKTS
jgi:hypothetical protein